MAQRRCLRRGFRSAGRSSQQRRSRFRARRAQHARIRPHYQVPSGKKTIEHSIRQLVVELRADTIRLLDRPSTGEQNQFADIAVDDETPE